MTDHHPKLWETSTSIYDIPVEPRPILKDISIVIPTLGRDILEQSLYWIVKGSAWPACLIIVNQGAKDKVDGWLQHLQSYGISVKHICSNQRGRSAGINRGIEQVETPFFAITDDDCFVESNWLQNITSLLRQHANSIVTGRVEAAGEDMLLVVTSTAPAVYQKPRLKFDSMSGGNMGTSIAVVKKVGLFDEDPCMRTAEDAEWAYRALRNKITIRYEPDVCVWHFGWRDLGKRDEQYKHYALSHGGFYGKYLRKGDLFILGRLSIHFLRTFRRWIRSKLSGNTEEALIGWAYVRYLLPGILNGLKSHQQSGKSI